MTTAQRDALVREMEAHEHEIGRLSCELWWLDAVAACYVEAGSARQRLAREIEFTTAQITKRRIRVALLSSRLAHE